jgi:ABC-type dipeptide/oligopeptide/nickel transport system ATPase component
MAAAAPLLQIENLSIEFRSARGPVHALRNVSLAVPRGSIVGVVGESGSGKSTLALATMGLLQNNATISGGRIDFDGRDLLKLDLAELRDLRGRRISMVFQDPMTALNPVLSIGRQMIDIQYRDAGSTADKRRKASELLHRVGIPDAEQRLDQFPN